MHTGFSIIHTLYDRGQNVIQLYRESLTNMQESIEHVLSPMEVFLCRVAVRSGPLLRKPAQTQLGLGS